MQRTRTIKATAAVGLAALLVAACGATTDSPPAAAATGAAGPTPLLPALPVPPARQPAERPAAAAAAAPDSGLAVDVSKCTEADRLDGEAATAMGHAGTVRRLLRRGRQGLLRGRRASTSQIVEGGVDISPQKTLASGAVDFAISWVPKALAEREAGAKVTDIAQVFQRSGTLQVSFKDKNITSAEDFEARRSATGASATSTRSSRP